MMQKFLSEDHFKRSLLLIWLVGSLLLLAASWQNILAWQMGDPDDQLRLVQVRDLLAGQGWWDVTQYRMNLPDGGPMHWSRLVDIPPAILIWLLTPLVGQGLAEHAASAIIPLLTYGIVIFLLAKAAQQVFNHHVALLAAAALFATIPAINQLLPMRIDHHGWQLAAFLAALAAFTDPARTVRNATVIGIAFAVWLEISVEALPFMVIFMGLLALRWLTAKSGDRATPQFPVAMGALALTSFGLLLANEGPVFAAIYCDSLSLFHVVALAAMALPIIVAALVNGAIPRRYRRVAKVAACAAAGAGGLASIYLIAPQCAGDAFANLDPLVRKFWYDKVPEGLPVWAVQPQFAVPVISGLIASGIAAIWFLFKSETPKFPVRAELTLLFSGSAIIGILVQRTSLYALCIGVILAAALAINLFRRSDKLSFLPARLGTKILAVMLLAPAIFGQNGYNLFKSAITAPAASAQATEDNFQKLAKLCHKVETIKLLDGLPPANLMAGLDVSPSLLQHTHHSVVATGHHRNQDAMKDVILAFTAPPEQVRAIFEKRKIAYLITCPGSFELHRYQVVEPAGLLARLRDGNAPDWLTAQRDIGPYKIWRFTGNKTK
ncbi:MAG: hypothetical protein V3V15_03390 [Sphingorhabdus sp.]